MPKLIAFVVSSSLLVSLGACRREVAAPAAPVAAPAVAALPADGLSLAARLDREAKSRPSDTPRVEEVLAAFTRGGLSLDEEQQVLASTIGASYCRSAVSARGVAVAVCEYSAEEQARRGLDYSRRTFDRLIPGRRLLLNRKTLLTITSADNPEAATAAQIFARL